MDEWDKINQQKFVVGASGFGPTMLMFCALRPQDRGMWLLLALGVAWLALAWWGRWRSRRRWGLRVVRGARAIWQQALWDGQNSPLLLLPILAACWMGLGYMDSGAAGVRVGALATGLGALLLVLEARYPLDSF